MERAAMMKVAEATEWLVEKPTAKSMAEDIRNTAIGKVRGLAGEDGRYVIITYQPRLAAEPASAPHIRTPPLRLAASLPGGAHYKKMIQAIIQARLPDQDIGNPIYLSLNLVNHPHHQPHHNHHLQTPPSHIDYHLFTGHDLWPELG